jgi:hypothetical protein
MRQIREELDGLVDADEEELSDQETAQQAADLAKRLEQSIYAIEKQGHPCTGSDLATMRAAAVLLGKIGGHNGEGDAKESLRAALGIEDEAKAARGRRRLQEWLRS